MGLISRAPAMRGRLCPVLASEGGAPFSAQYLRRLPYSTVWLTAVQCGKVQ